jgi:hypothetical protein
MDEPEMEYIEIVFLKDCNSYVLKIDGGDIGVSECINLHFKTKELIKAFTKKLVAEVKKLDRRKNK